MKLKYLLGSLAVVLLLSGCNDDKTEGPRLYALYGDYSSTKVFKIDTREMKDVATLDVSPAQGPYGVECDSKTEAFALTRRGESIAVINFRTNKVVDVIPLRFKPRSTATLPGLDLVLVSGKSKPMAVTIGKRDHKVRRYYGIDTDEGVDKLHYFGGGNATGHPFWLADGHRFLLLDRVHRKIFLFDKDDETPLNSIDTETTAHHVLTLKSEYDVNGNGDYYVVLEGPKDANDSAIPAAGIMKLRIDAQNGMQIVKIFHADHASGGAHHAGFYADRYLFLPTYNKKVYVVDKETMEKVAEFPAGLGGGHITFSPKKKIAVVTNHKDTFVTIVDIKDPTHPQVIENVEVAKPLTDEEREAGKNAQSHTSHFDDSGRYFYSVANCDHKFYELDTEYGWISRTCHLDGNYIPMGDFVRY
ncbi:hypothetical protein [Hydrogenimonas sp. SS33]|uniref:hypothetical protein n=1 Tax=Hydrogenimonas leucolamina TaxID=2954236 RepID=UPI00336C044F